MHKEMKVPAVNRTFMLSNTFETAEFLQESIFISIILFRLNFSEEYKKNFSMK